MSAQIKQCFNKATLTYDSYSQNQQAIGHRLINLVKNHSAKNIIDLGCGTGLVTSHLANTINYEFFYAIDIADKLLAVAKEKLLHYSINIVENNFDDFHFKNILFDLAFSNMALQWSYQLDKTLLNIHKNLLNNGVLAFSIPISGTFHELTDYYKNNFSTQEKIIETLHETGFTLIHCCDESVINYFDSLYLAMKSIKLIGANFSFNRNKKLLLSKKHIFDNKTTSLTYKIGYFIAKKV